MMDNLLIRQHDLISKAARDSQIHIIGCGAIGGWTALALASCGYTNLTLWDDDIVEEENVGPQLYGMNDIGQPKVVALANLLLAKLGCTVTRHYNRYEGEVLPGIVIAAVDNMATRAAIWEAHAGRAVHTRAIVDPRMAIEELAVYCADPRLDDPHKYHRTLHSDADSVQESCTNKATAYTGMLAGGYVASIVKQLTHGEQPPHTFKWHIASHQIERWPR